MSKKDIDHSIAEKEAWILKSLAKQRVQGEKKEAFSVDYDSIILYRGNQYMINQRAGTRAGFDGDVIYMLPNLTPEQIKATCVQIYKRLAKAHLTSRVVAYAVLTGVNPAAVKINNTMKRWGSCSSKKSLNFSWRLIMANDSVIDYVVIHELVHLVEMNHLKRCHVKNTGRCKELLIPNARVYVNHSDKPERITNYDLVAVWKGERLVNMDSQAPNKVFFEYLQSGRDLDGTTHIKSEATYGDSRFDFYMEAGERRIFIEVKGVTLEADGIAIFPDAPTERGIHHFAPNIATHPAFGITLSDVVKSGVKAVAFDCLVTHDSLTINNPAL